VPTPPAADVTKLLVAWGRGDDRALERLLPQVYRELRALAHRRMRAEGSGVQTLQTTALVHEAYVRLVDGARVDWHDRAHFYAVCARLMRRILIDRARARRAAKRGGEAVEFPIEDCDGAQPASQDDLLALDEALERLTRADPRKGRVVELRYFGGLSVEDTAAALGISVETVKRDWKTARTWLRRDLRLRPGAPDEGPK
jgi:RNA polymerase sigma-70 factor (ECF subfamily)